MKTSKSFTTTLTIITLTLLTATSTQQQPTTDSSMLYLNEFQIIQSAMLPTESFTMDINPGQSQKIALWPQADVSKVTIVFYTHNEENPELVTGEGFYADCQVNGVVHREFPGQKLGVCEILIERRPSFVDLNFRSEKELLTVYVGYEFERIKAEMRPHQAAANQNVPTEQQDKRSQLQKVNDRFKKVEKNSELQQGALRLITKSLNKHNTRFSNNLKYVHHRIVIESLFVVISGLLGMWIVRKQLTSGYELLV